MSEPLRSDLIETIGRWEGSGSEGPPPTCDVADLATDMQRLMRDGEPAHFTASALPMTVESSRVCLVLHRRMGLWVQPGGHFEPHDRSVTGAAAREMGEETGLVGELDPAPLGLARHRAPHPTAAWHLDVQLLATCEDAARPVGDDSEEAAWFDSRRLSGDLAPGVADLVRLGLGRLSRSDSPRPPPPGV